MSSHLRVLYLAQSVPIVESNAAQLSFVTARSSYFGSVELRAMPRKLRCERVERIPFSWRTSSTHSDGLWAEFGCLYVLASLVELIMSRGRVLSKFHLYNSKFINGLRLPLPLLPFWCRMWSFELFLLLNFIVYPNWPSRAHLQFPGHPLKASSEAG